MSLLNTLRSSDKMQGYVKYFITFWQINSIVQKANEYNQEMPQSQTAEQSTTL